MSASSSNMSSPPVLADDSNDLDKFIRQNLSGYGIKKLPDKQLLIENIFSIASSDMFVPPCLVDSFQNLVVLKT